MNHPTASPLLALALLAPVAVATSNQDTAGHETTNRGESVELVDVGSFAPPGRWSTDGGGAARTGRSLAAPVRSEPIEAWKVTMRGTIEGEPRVSDGSVILSVREAPTRCALQILELSSGRTLLHQVLPANLPLEPAVWSDRVVLRPEKNRLDIYRIRGQRLFLLRSIRGRESVSPPLIENGELYVRVDDTLRRYDIDRREPVWTSTVQGSFCGTPSVRGGGVYAIRYDQRGNAMATILSRETGELVSSAKVGHHGGEVPGSAESAGVVVLNDTVFLHYPRPVPATSGKLLEYGRVARDGERLDESAGGLNAILARPISWSDGWLALDEDTGSARWSSARNVAGGVEVTVLANAQNHPELTNARIPASRTADVVYMAGVAADLRTREILWKRPAPLMRPVPADGYLLVVEEARTLTALREPEPARSPAARTVSERAAELDGQVTEGYALLAYQSLRLGDAQLTARLLDQAIRRGAQGRAVDSARDGLERLSRARAVTVDARRLAAIHEEEAALIRRPGIELFENALAARDPALQRSYLRATLEHAPTHAEAIAAVRALIPADATVTTPFSPTNWLDLLDTIASTPIRFLHPESSTPTSPDLERLKTEASEWRNDVDGFRSERLFVIAPPANPAAVARCLEIGEFVCDVLEGIFETGPSGGTDDPMTMFLYGSRDEYIAQSRRDRSGPEVALGWTAGHYSSAENISRVFVPQDDETLERLLSVYAHELTHHWLATRAPFANRYSDPDFPYWIVEGFATLIDEFELDVRAGTWNSINPRADSLDVVANASEDDLLPWESVLTLTHHDFNRLGRERHTSVPLTWRLGVRAEQSETQLFYAQSGALCHYLFNSTPQNRKRLTDYVTAWYQHQVADVDARRAFGADLKALGQATREYAKKTVASPAR